ncbi:MAG: hypothetical protein ABFR36_07535 [Acidobacteriota bacterium]
MKLLKKIALTCMIMALTLTFFTTQAPAYELQKKFVASDAKWLIHLDFKALMKTRLWDGIYDKKKLKVDYKNEKLLKELDFDMLTDLNAISVYGVDKGDKNAVVLIRGNFDRVKIIAKLLSEEDPEISTYGKFKIYNWDGDDYGTFAGKDLLIITHSKVNMKYALDVITGEKKNFKSSALSKRLKEVPGDALLFALAGDLSKMIGKHHKAPMMIDKSRMALFLAMERNNDLRLYLKLHTESPEAAKNLMQVGNGILALARMSKGKLEGKEKLINSINISADRNIVSADMLIPSDVLMENIRNH